MLNMFYEWIKIEIHLSMFGSITMFQLDCYMYVLGCLYRTDKFTLCCSIHSWWFVFYIIKFQLPLGLSQVGFSQVSQPESASV